MPFITDLLSKVTNLRIKIGDKLNILKNQIGQLNLLTTNDKTSLVEAINEVNNIQIGGRNLILNSKSLEGRTDFYGGLTTAVMPLSVKLEKDKEYIFTYKNNNDIPRAEINTITLRNANGETIQDIQTIGDGSETIFKVNIDDVVGIAFYSVWKNAFFSFRELMLTSGNKIVDWTPAPEDQVSDWNETDSTKHSFIKNKPTVNNGQLTLSTGTGLSGSANFTANQAEGSTFSVAVANTHKLPTITEWNATLANTAYTAGNGLTLSGTTFSLPVTTSGSGNVVSEVTQTTNGITVNKGISAMTTSHVANGITATQITNWNTAFTNSHTHSNKSYLDTINQSLNTNSSPTFANVTATNFNGSASFLQHNPTGLLNATYGINGGILQDSTNSPEFGQWTNRIKILHNNSEGYYTELAHSFTGTEGLWHRRNTAGTVSSWKRIVDGGTTNVVGGNAPFGGVNWKVQIIASDYAPVMDVFVHKNSRFTIGSTSNAFESIELLTTYGSVIFDNAGLQSSLGISAPSFRNTSLRKFKDNIQEFKLSGVELIDSLDIVTFDRNDTKEKDVIGIIADDTNEEFLSPEKDSVDLYKTIFIQAKAIQELSEKIEELEKIIKEKIK